ncbi:MAG: FMN-binding glutamate synthase family protein [Planctomycetota bacterium]|nr:FMN-binding glutamate synthase family protein [Planctomycetota bacterium]
MTFTRYNATAATLTKNRTGGDWCPVSGMCVTCVDGCIGMCEIGKSAYRGHECIYPQPFGIITTASQKDYPVDLSHFNIMGTTVGAVGIEEDSDKAIFPNVNLESKLGRGKGIKLRLPIVIPGLGSTNIALQNWEGLAIGSAISGTVLTIGENVCGMDEKSEIKNGRVVRSPELERRVGLFKEWQRDGYGEIVLQANVEDTRLGVQEYAIEKLGVTAVELKWGQGAKDIGGEVKIRNLEKAQLLKKRGYVVLPDPLDPKVVDEFKKGAFTEFERHSRVGMVTEEGFLKRVEELRKAGAKFVSLKTGAYRPADLARAVKWSSIAKIDYLTVDASGGGTGMSPWRMMNEWGVPGIELWSLLYQYCERLAKKGEYVPDIVLASGFVLEDQMFKGFALCAPYVKAIGMARGPLAAAMVGKTIGNLIASGNVPIFFERYGKTRETIFVTAEHLKREYGKDYERIPTSAIALYTYYERLAQGMRQLMCGARKFALKYITRDDIAALTPQAAKISGIPLVSDLDAEEVEKILG